MQAASDSDLKFMVVKFACLAGPAKNATGRQSYSRHIEALASIFLALLSAKCQEKDTHCNTAKQAN